MEAALRVRTTTALLGAAALGSAFLVSGGATAAQVDSVTGGGQVLVSQDGNGAGSTIAFTATDTGDGEAPDSGQVQYVNRQAGNGKDQTVSHGTVTCVMVDDDQTARIGGTWTSGDLAGQTFGIYVRDLGNGAGSDFVAVTPFVAGECAEERDDDGQFALARGDAQIHNRAE